MREVIYGIIISAAFVFIGIPAAYFFAGRQLALYAGALGGSILLFVIAHIMNAHYDDRSIRKEKATTTEQIWHPPVIQATHFLEGDKVTLLFFLGRDSRNFAIEIMCSVTDPDNLLYWSEKSGPSVTASATGVNSFSFNVWYPDSFDGAPSLRPGTYKVHWFIATDSKHVIATDTFEVPQKN
jgi:hypothetical protein